MELDHISYSCLKYVTYAKAEHDYVHIGHAFTFTEDDTCDENVQQSAYDDSRNEQHLESHLDMVFDIRRLLAALPLSYLGIDFGKETRCLVETNFNNEEISVLAKYPLL